MKGLVEIGDISRIDHWWFIWDWLNASLSAELMSFYTARESGVPIDQNMIPACTALTLHFDQSPFLKTFQENGMSNYGHQKECFRQPGRECRIDRGVQLQRLWLNISWLKLRRAAWRSRWETESGGECEWIVEGSLGLRSSSCRNCSCATRQSETGCTDERWCAPLLNAM